MSSTKRESEGPRPLPQYGDAGAGSRTSRGEDIARSVTGPARRRAASPVALPLVGGAARALLAALDLGRLRGRAAGGHGAAVGGAGPHADALAERGGAHRVHLAGVVVTHHERRDGPD